MKNYISEIFKKKGIKDESELSPDERATVKRWRAVLSEGEITVEKIKEFCESQVSILEAKISEKVLDGGYTENFALLLTVYKKLIRIITAPQAEREALEKYLNQLVLDSNDASGL